METKNYCPACEHLTVVSGHCNYCGHHLKTIPYRSVWEIAEKFLPRSKTYQYLPHSLRKQHVFRRHLHQRIQWIQERMGRETTDDLIKQGFQLELEQVRSWYGGKDLWRELGVTMPGKSSFASRLWPEVKQKKAFTLLLILGAVFTAPFIAHILLRLVLVNLHF